MSGLQPRPRSSEGRAAAGAASAPVLPRSRTPCCTNPEHRTTTRHYCVSTARGSVAAVLEGRSPVRAGEKPTCLSDSLQQTPGDAPGGSAHGALPETLAALHRDAKLIIIFKKRKKKKIAESQETA